jgi:ectoine hydroxylase-related dioxygenase (phytanoyl-CoA dioxygenase family)
MNKMITKTTRADQSQQEQTHQLVIVKASYTVKKEFVSVNQENIRAFIADLRDHQQIRYVAFLGDDGQTFTHLAINQSDEAQKELLSLVSFQNFIKQRDENLVGTPRLESVSLVASSFDIFNF